MMGLRTLPFKNCVSLCTHLCFPTMNEGHFLHLLNSSRWRPSAYASHSNRSGLCPRPRAECGLQSHQRVRFYNLCKDTLCSTAALAIEAYEVLLNKTPGILLTPMSLVGKGERKNIIDSFLLFVTPAKPFFSTLHFGNREIMQKWEQSKSEH